MKETLITALNKSALQILRPLIRTMLRNGVSCGNFEELVRKTYVDEAYSIENWHGKQSKTTISSVSAQTGLSRKEVKRLKEIEQVDHHQNDQKYNRATRVISGWMHHKEFLDRSGNPVPLRLDDIAPSFSHLIKTYSGDIPAKAMLDLLINANCVEINNDMVYLIKPAYLPGTGSTEVARILGTDTAELLETISHNLTASDNNKRFQRKVSTLKLDKAKNLEFQKIAAQHSQALLEHLDTWLLEHETHNNEDSQYVSVGVYYYEDKDKEDHHD